MRCLSTANFLWGSWLSSHTSFSRVNKCRVWGWVGGYDNFSFLQKTIILMRQREETAEKINEIARVGRRGGGGKTYQSNGGRRNSPFCVIWRSSKANATHKRGWYVSGGLHMAFFSTLWCFLTPGFCGMTATHSAAPGSSRVQYESPLKCHKNIKPEEIALRFQEKAGDPYRRFHQF